MKTKDQQLLEEAYNKILNPNSSVNKVAIRRKQFDSDNVFQLNPPLKVPEYDEPVEFVRFAKNKHGLWDVYNDEDPVNAKPLNFEGMFNDSVEDILRAQGYKINTNQA